MHARSGHPSMFNFKSHKTIERPEFPDYVFSCDYGKTHLRTTNVVHTLENNNTFHKTTIMASTMKSQINKIHPPTKSSKPAEKTLKTRKTTTKVKGKTTNHEMLRKALVRTRRTWSRTSRRTPLPPPPHTPTLCRQTATITYSNSPPRGMRTNKGSIRGEHNPTHQTGWTLTNTTRRGPSRCGPRLTRHLPPL